MRASRTRDLHGVGFELVVPAEPFSAARKTQSYFSRRNLDATVRYGRAYGSSRFGLPDFLIQRQLMEHVGQGFGVHEPVLDGHVEQSIKSEAIGQRSVKVGHGVEFVVEGRSDCCYVVVDVFDGRPVRRQIGGQPAADRIDAKGKQLVEVGVKTLDSEHPFVEQIPVESLEVPDVKNDAVTLGDGPVVE
jgi:hypothetical protein